MYTHTNSCIMYNAYTHNFHLRYLDFVENFQQVIVSGKFVNHVKCFGMISDGLINAFMMKIVMWVYVITKTVISIEKVLSTLKSLCVTKAQNSLSYTQREDNRKIYFIRKPNSTEYFAVLSRKWPMPSSTTIGHDRYNKAH